MRVCLSLFCCCFLVAAGAQTLSPRQFKSTDFQRFEAKKVDNGALFQAYLRDAELFIVDANFGGAQEVLAKAALLKAPNSDWYLLLAKTHAGLGQYAEMLQTLKDGQKIYPFSPALGGTLSLQLIADAEPKSYADLLKLPLPSVGKNLAIALWCYNNHEPVNGMLHTLHAYYAGGQNRLPQELIASFEEASALFLSGSQDSVFAGDVVENKLDHVYGRSLVVAAKAMRQDTSVVSGCRKGLEELVCLQKAALRHFADRSGLGRFPEPLLVDLYILDQAGYLEWALYELFSPLYPQEYLALKKKYPTHAAAAKTYIEGKWATDVNSWLNRVGE